MRLLPVVSQTPVPGCLGGCERFGEPQFCCSSCQGVQGDGGVIGEHQPRVTEQGSSSSSWFGTVGAGAGWYGLGPFCPPRFVPKGPARGAGRSSVCQRCAVTLR